MVPLIVSGKPRGVIALQDYEREHAFGESEVRLLQTLAGSMSVALENARLFDETQRLLKETEQRNAELAVINSVQQGLAGWTSMKSSADRSEGPERVRGGCRGDCLYDHPNHNKLPFILTMKRYFHDPQPIYGVFRHFLTETDPIRINTSAEMAGFFAEFEQNNIGGPTNDQSHVILPLRSGGVVLGVISVGKLVQYSFNDDDVRLLQTLANSMTVAQCPLFDETRGKR
jgi:GAF domain-containing protein